MELQLIQNKIYGIRGVRVMLDFDIAELYKVETKILNRAVKRNLERFPDRFMFQLDKQEFENLRFQIGTSSWGGTRYLPYAFTEQGVSMLSEEIRRDMDNLYTAIGELSIKPARAEKPRRPIGFKRTNEN